MARDKVDELYDYLKEDGWVEKSREHFRAFFYAPGAQGYKNRKALYENMKEDGYVESPTYEEFARRMGMQPVQQKPAAPTPQPKPAPKPAAASTAGTYRAFKVRRGGKDMYIPETEVKASGGLYGWAAKHPGAPLRVYMHSRDKGRTFTGHVDLSQAHNRSAKDGYFYTTVDVRSNAKPAGNSGKGIRPTAQQAAQFHNSLQQQLATGNAQLRQQTDDAVKRMDALKKGNRPDAGLGKVKINPKNGKWERQYTTVQGKETGSRMEQSQQNTAYNTWWENNTEQGRRSKEQRLQREFDERMAGLWRRNDSGEGANAVERAWNDAALRTRTAQTANADRTWDGLSGGPEMRVVNASLTAHGNQVARLTNFDLDRLMNESWNNLGTKGQKALVDDCYKMLVRRYPGADGIKLYEEAKKMARQQSDLRLYNYAVEKNRPKSELAYLMRKIGDMNMLGNIQKGLAVSRAGSTGDMSAYEAANEQYRQDGHKVLDVAGTVAGFALDPTTWLSGGIGSATTKGVLSLAGRGATAAVKKAATRKFATSMTGRVLGGMAGGAANFGAFEGIKELENQFAHGGKVTDQNETGRYVNEGYSASAVGEQALHGFLMGGLIGWISPVSGNVSDRLVGMTENTIGKVVTRGGVFTGATIAEGTIFSVPEWMEGERDGFDVWTDNMAMMAGFKAKHVLKSAGGVLGDLKASFQHPSNGSKNRLDFESRLRMRMDAPSDGGMALTKDEKEELQRYGYDLSDLVKSSESTGNAAEGSLIARNAPEIVSHLTEMVTDSRVSEAARAKMYYYATGRKLPMSTVMRGELMEDGKGGFIVESQGANGVITSRRYTNRKAADLELRRIKRQVELNQIELGERYQQTADLENRLQDACRSVAAENGWDPVTVYRLCEEARRDYQRGENKELDEARKHILRQVTEAMGEFEETAATDIMRGRINDKFGVDIDAAIRKEPTRRSDKEQKAIDAYIAALFPEKGKEVNSVVDADAEDLTGQQLLPESDTSAGKPAAQETKAGEERAAETPLEERTAETPGGETTGAAVGGEVSGVATDGEMKPIGRAVMKYQDREVEVLSGNIVMTDDGTMVDNARSDSVVVVRDKATGKKEMVSPQAILTYESYPAEPEPAEAPEAPARKYGKGVIRFHDSDGKEKLGWITGDLDDNGRIEYYAAGEQRLRYATEEELDGIIISYEPDKPAPATAQPRFALNDEFTIMGRNGEMIQATVTKEVNEDGLVEVYTEQPINGSVVNQFTPEELTGMVATYNGEAISRPEEAPQGEVSMPTGVNPVGSIAVPQQDGSTRTFAVGKNAEGENVMIDERGFMWAHDGNGNALQPYSPGANVPTWTDEQLAKLGTFQPTNEQTATVSNQPESVPATAETPQNPTENSVSAVESVPKPAVSVENVQETPTTASTAEPTPLQRLPRDAKGEPVFERAESAEHGWDALVEFSEGDAATAKEIADTMAEEKRKAYEKAQKQKPKGKTPTEILASKKAITAGLAQAEQEYNLWQQMANVEQRRQDAIRAQQEAEARQRAAERAEAEKAEREAREEAARLEREALEGIPEWHLDTPENARKRGVRRFSGQMFTRQEPVQGVVGHEVEVKFSQKDLPKGHVAVIEASQLQPSHIQGQRNPMFFIEEAQPKNRAEAVSMFAAKEMAEGIRPQEITGSATAYTGAPTINSRGEVIQGNNRSDALRYLWENKLPEQQQTYKQYLIDNAEQFGLDPEAVSAMQQPVLVNMLDVDDSEAIRLGQMTAQDTESGGVERIKPKNVAQKLGEGMRTFANRLLESEDEGATFGQLVDSNGVEVMKWLAQKGAITNTQYQSAFDSKGNLTAEAKNDLQKVLYQAVFKGGTQQLEEMFAALPMKAQRAILSTAFRDMDSPFAGKMLPEIQSSIIAYQQLMTDSGFANAKKLEDVLRSVEGWKMQSALDDRFEQYYPSDNFSNFALHLAAMYKASDMSQSTLAGYFNQMYDLAQGKKAGTLFEEADTTEYPLAEVIKQVLNIDYQPAKNGNNNVANGGADVALRNQDGQGGELRGNEPPAGGEQNPAGTEPSERGAGTSDDSRGVGNLRVGGKGETAAQKERLTKEEASGIIAEMEEKAIVAPEIELTIENWDAQFGEDGIVSTPIGNVKMGENQFAKLMRQGRNGKLGMIKPTLETPDIIIEDASEAKDAVATERESSYVFVKTFVKPDGSRYYYFTSVTVSKDGHEVVISNQEKRRNVLTNLLMKGKLVWKHADDASSASDVADGLFSPQGNMSDPVSEGTDAPQTNVSGRKVSDSASEKQGNGEESSGDREEYVAQAGKGAEAPTLNKSAKKTASDQLGDKNIGSSKRSEWRKKYEEAILSYLEELQHEMPDFPIDELRQMAKIDMDHSEEGYLYQEAEKHLNELMGGKGDILCDEYMDWSLAHQGKNSYPTLPMLIDEINRLEGKQTIQSAVESASAQVNTEPTPAQAEAGNYKKGHVRIGEFDITIENPAGSVRKGVDADGKEWSNTMANTYGYIKGTEGVDGDHIDVFLHSDMDQWNGRKVFVVDQTNRDGSFDEHKVMLGFNDKDEAMSAYLANYDKTWGDTHPGLRISETNIEDFKKWVESSHRKTKPFADYTTVSKVVDEAPLKEGSSATALAQKESYSVEGENLPEGYGDFGPIFTQFKGDAQGAIKLLKELQDGEATGALHHKDVGDIDLVWGKAGSGKSDGYGLAKLLKYHPEVVEHLQEILDDMHIVKRSENRINLESDTHKAAVRLTWNNKKKKWLLTAFEKKETPESIGKTTDTDDNPSDMRGDTALSQNSDVSVGKGNTLSTEKQVEDSIGSSGYKIEPKPYTNKRGKTLDTYLVTFDRDFSKEELSALCAKAKALKGWYDRESKGWMLRGSDDAKAFADEVTAKSEDEVADEAPLSMADMGGERAEASTRGERPAASAERKPTTQDSGGESRNTPKTAAAPTQEASKPKKRRWISDEDADEFDSLRKDLRNHFGKDGDIVQEAGAEYGKSKPRQMDAEVLRMGTRMTYLMMKGGLRSFSDYCEAMKDELPDIFDEMRPHLKSLYAAAQNMEEVIELGWDEEMDDRKSVKAFDVYNFDKPGAKDIIATAKQVVDENASQKETEKIIGTLKERRNEKRKQAKGTKPLSPLPGEDYVDLANRVTANTEAKRQAKEAQQTGDLFDGLFDEPQAEAVPRAEPVEGVMKERLLELVSREDLDKLTPEQRGELEQYVSRGYSVPIWVVKNPNDIASKTSDEELRELLQTAYDEEDTGAVYLREIKRIVIFADERPILRKLSHEALHAAIEEYGLRHGDKLSKLRRDALNGAKAGGWLERRDAGIRHIYEPAEREEEFCVYLIEKLGHSPEKAIKLYSRLSDSSKTLINALIYKVYGQREGGRIEETLRDTRIPGKRIQQGDGIDKGHRGRRDRITSPEREAGNDRGEKRAGSELREGVAGGELTHSVGADATGADGRLPAPGAGATDRGGTAIGARTGVERRADGPTHGTDADGGLQPFVGNRGRDAGRTDRGSDDSGMERGGTSGAGIASGGSSDGGAERLSEGESSAVAGSGSGSASVKSRKKPEVRYTHNFRYDEKGNEADSYTPLQRLDANVKAVETLAEVLFGDTPATEEQKAIMSRFRGWGQVDLGKYYDVDHILRSTYQSAPLNRLARVIQRLDPTGEKKLFEAIKRASLSSYYTPTPIARAINTFLPLTGYKGGNLLDPSMGNGIFEGTLPKGIQERTSITGVELDWLSGQLSRALYPDANVMISAFEKSGIAPGSFDVVTSNVPFGDIVVNDPTWRHDSTPLKRSAQNRLHNYYAVKMLEAARPGGLVVMMTTSAVMDTPSNQNIRAHIADQGEILGAIRLPDNTFQGTGVVTDVIFVRKWRDADDRLQTREDAEYKETERAFLSQHETTASNKLDGSRQKVKHNAYYKKYPRNLIGDIQAGNQYGKKDAFGLTSKKSVEDIATEVEQAIKRIVGNRRGSLFNPARTVRETQQALRAAYKGNGDWVSNGNLVVQDGKVGVLTTKSNEYGEVSRTFEGTLKHDRIRPRIESMINLRTSMKKLIAGQIEGEKEKTLSALRVELQKAYDAFVNKYGRLQDKSNDFILDDIDGYTLQALEKWKNGKFVGLSDIFTKNSIKPSIRLAGEKTPQEAVALSLAEYGYLRPDYLAKTLGEDWVEKCGDVVFLTPNSVDDYVTRDEYLSGDVVTKLADARAAAEKDKSFERNVRALEEVQPERIPFDDIAIHLGARWIPEDILNDFVNELLGIHASYSSRSRKWDPELGRYVNVQKSGVRYLPETDSFEINIEKKELGGAASDWETPKKSAKEILQAALEDKTLVITYKDKDGITHVDEEQTELANQKIADLRERFEAWLPSDPERADLLEHLYNDRFNRTIKRHFDGTHLIVPGLMDKELRPHQKDAVWMLINNRGGIVDHIVGAGKTLVMQSAIMEMRRMGIAKKPMIVALKSTVAQIAREFKESFPSARVLAPNDKDFKKKNRKKFIANISLNDYDCVILSHEQYCMLPHTEEAERAVIDEQMWQLDNMIEYLYGTNDTSQMTKKQIKALEKRRENLKARLEKRLARNVDREFCFENLGVDYLFVDESHQFKSLPYVTSYQKVAGLGDPQGSNRAVALLTGIRHLQRMHQGDKGTVFLSGTTITNSLVETYNLLNYLRPRKLEELGIPTFDAWASTFAVHTSELEATVTGGFALKDRFRQFDNVAELSRLYAEIADVRNDQNLKLPKPGIEAHTVIVPESAAMSEINAEIVHMIETKNGTYFGIHPKDPQREPWALQASTISAKAAVSPRLVFPDMEDDGGKVHAVCENVKKYYDEMAEQRGVQLIFCEMGVPGKDKKYDAYTDMVNRFVNDYGIPRSEIAYIQEANNELKRKELFQRVRDGKVRILIGGTKNMGTGVNVQDRITDMHMLTVPWTPAALEQCIGRGGRQGNVVARDFMGNKVRVHYYATEGSLDLYKYQLLDAKGKMITQFKMGTVSGTRSFDEGSADEEGNMDPAEMVAILSGNPVIFERAKQEKLVKKLRALRNGFERDYQRKKAKYEELQRRKENFERLIRLNDRDRADLERNDFKPDDKGVYPSKVTINDTGSYYGGRTFDKPKEAGEYLLDALDKGKNVTLQGFGQRARVVTVNEEKGNSLFSYRELQIGEGDGRSIRYSVRLSDDATAAGVAYRNLLKRIVDNGEAYRRSLEEVNTQLSGMNIGDGVYPKQKEYEAAVAKLKELNAEYNKLGKGKNGSEPTTREPEEEYSAENANFTSRYETKDGKTVRYTSENPEAYGGLFDFDFRGEGDTVPITDRGGEDSGVPVDNLRAGAGLLQRRGGEGRLYESGLRGGLEESTGEFGLVERVFRETGSFNFTSGERIGGAEDVAYIFSALEDAAKEHSFAVFVKEGVPTVVELGMGTLTGTMVDMPTASLAYSRIRPDEVYFVHNHPSGNLKCSPQDVQMLRLFERMSDVPVHGVIINLKTGKYGTFDSAGVSGEGMKRVPTEEYPLRVHTLDKQIFAADYDPMSQPLVRSSRDVAEFLNSQRMGDRGKVSFLILSRAGRIVGNLHTPFTGLSSDSRGMARYISERVIQLGGESAILYGDFDIDSGNGAYRSLREGIEAVTGRGVKLLDVVNVEGNHTRSAMDEGLLEPGGEYGGDIREREAFSDVSDKSDGSEGQTSAEAKRGYAEALGRKLNTGLRVVEDGSKLPAHEQRRKGWYRVDSGEVVVVLGNHRDVGDVAATVFHEAVAHKGLREMLGDENYDAFCDEVYDHLKDDLKEGVDRETTHRFEREPERGYEYHRRVSVDEMFGRLAEKGFEDFTKAERGIWRKLREKVLEVINRFLGSLRLPKWVRLGDNELRYILWRSHERLRGGASDYVEMAKDVAKREELGLNRDDVVRERNPKLARIEKLRRSEPVVVTEEMIPEGVDIKDRKSVQKSLMENIRGEYVNADTRETLHVMRQGIEEVTHHGMTDEAHVKSLFAIPQMLRQAIYIDERLNDKGKRAFDSYRYYVCGLKINDEDYTAKIVVGVKDGQRYYDHRLTQIEKGAAIEKAESFRMTAASNNAPESGYKGTTLESLLQVNEPESEYGYRYRDGETGDISTRDRVMARRAYERIVRSGSYQFREAVQDSMLGLKILYKAILGKGVRIEDVPGYENAYLFENRMSSMNAGEQHEYFIRYMRPLLKEIGKICGSSKSKRRKLTEYLMAKHGLERNEYMRNEADAKGEKTDRDFAGLTGLTGEADWQSAEATARRLVDDYEAENDTAPLWEKVNKATKATLEKIYLSGIISKDTYEKIRDMYEYYVPLRGWDETTSEQVYGYLTDKDGPLGGNIMKKAEGRRSMADDPVATIGMMADEAIRQGNRNLMKQCFLNFILHHPSDAVSVHDLWLQYNNVTKEWEPVFADVKDTDTADEVTRKIEAFEQRMEALQQTEPNNYKKGREAQHIPYKVVRDNLREHQILIKRNGRTYVATINGNPRAAQALNGLTNPDVDQHGIVGNMLKAGEWFNRQLSAFYTTRNPEFVVSNFFRDMLYSNCMTWVKESPRYAFAFHKNFGKFMPISPRRVLHLRKGIRGGAVYSTGMLMRKWENGTLNMADKYEKLFYQFMRNGGETGYTNVRDIDGHKRAVSTELKKQSNIGRKVWSILGIQLDMLNRAVENCARFAAFVTSREFGRSIERSIYDAKEVSVNFNKKGSGGKMVNAKGQTALGKTGSYIGGTGRLAYVFWNAGIQGLTNFGRQAKRHPAKFTAGAGALYALGFIIPILAQMMSSDDEDDKNSYYNLPEYVRRSNICLRAGEQWITIPLPVEFRGIYGMGELTYGTISGNERYTGSELAYQMTAQISQIMPLDMLEGGGGISPFIPSAFKPVSEAYIMNKSWTGLPIYKDTPFNKNDPEWTKAYASADKHLVSFARWLNEISGGDDFKKGYIDINPARVEYLLNGTFGGFFTFPNKIKKTGETAFGERDFEWSNTPLANRLVKSGDERTANRKLLNEYFRYKQECEETGKLIRNYEKAQDNGVLGYAEKVSFLQNSPEYARWQVFNDFKRTIESYQDDIEAETDINRKSTLEAQYYEVMRELVNALHDPDKYIKEAVAKQNNR